MKKWKSFIATAALTVFCGAVLAGCGSGNSSSAASGGEGVSSLGPEAPKEAIAQLKLGSREVPLYEYKGENIPSLEGFHSNLAITKDAIYGISFDRESKEFHLQKMSLADGAIAKIEDLGIVTNDPISSDGSNVYFFSKESGLSVYDGNAVSTVPDKNAAVVRIVYGDTNAYTSTSFIDQSGIAYGTISKDGIKDPATVLSGDQFKEIAKVADETNAFLRWADKDGFYISTLAKNGGGVENWTKPFTQYGQDGKLIRAFEVNANLPAEAAKLHGEERGAIATKDYVVFYGMGYLRVFEKADGKYVGTIELRMKEGSVDIGAVVADNGNNIYFVGDKEKIYRIDL